MSLLSSKSRLSILLFLQFFIWGSWYLTLTTYLGKTLHFTGIETGAIYSTFAIAAIISPFIVGYLADQYLSPTRLITILHLFAGFFLLLASQTSSFWLLFSLILLHTLCYMPTLSLSNSISFSLLPEPIKQFPHIRIFGTVGFILAMVTVGELEIEKTNRPLIIAGVACIVQGLYSITLPYIKETKLRTNFLTEFKLKTFDLKRDKRFTHFLIFSLLYAIGLAFYYNFINLYLNDIGMIKPAKNMSLGQLSEFFIMLTIPLLFKKYGIRTIILSGIIAWTCRFLLFGFGDADTNLWMLYLGIVIHGLCYNFFYLAGQLYIDSLVSKYQRNVAQGLHTMVTYGLGALLGAWLSGSVVEYYSYDGQYNWRKIWLVPTIYFIVLGLTFLKSKDTYE